MWRPNATRQAAWLRVYIGYAPGVGKTYAMLHEGHRRRDRGTDVVVGWVQTYDRPHTVAAVSDLEVVPPRAIEYRGGVLHEMDVEAVIVRRPQVALVDELAHTNVPGSKHLKRYQDVLDLREYGINVISTVNIQHLASLQDTVHLLAGVTVSETLPDWVLDAADDLEMVDQTPDGLRKRLRRGNIQPREQVERALDSFFRAETLTALRELTLRRMALHTGRKFQEDSGLGEIPTSTSEETVLVCVLRGDEAQLLVRRGVRLAEQLRARLIVLSIAEPGGGLPDIRDTRGHQEIMKALQLARALGAEVHSEVVDANQSEALVRFAQGAGASQIVLGESTQSWFGELFGGSIVRDVLRRTKDVDVHIVRRTER